MLFTDINLLTYIFKTNKMPVIEKRWMSSLASYDIKRIYRAGKSNTNEDALSRKEDNLSKIINIVNSDITIGIRIAFRYI